MKALHFYAAAPHPHVASAVMCQVEKTLRPFNRYLRQAIRTARQRQHRYQLPWERVDGFQQITLRPVNHRVWVPRRRPAWRITDWPQDREPDTSRKLIVVSRDVMLNVVECSRDGTGLRFRPDGELRADDQVSWCDHLCTIEREPLPAAPAAIRDAQDQNLRLLRTPEANGDGWVLLVEGWGGNGALTVDGELVQPRAVAWSEGLQSLWDSMGRSFDLSDGIDLAGDTLRVTDLPAEGVLTGNNGIRFTWRGSGRRASAVANRVCWCSFCHRRTRTQRISSIPARPSARVRSRRSGPIRKGARRPSSRSGRSTLTDTSFGSIGRHRRGPFSSCRTTPVNSSFSSVPSAS